MPSVSVIVPNYNHARYLPQRIESILRQTYQDFELILMDDCSTDDSRAVLSQYASDPRVRIEFNEANSGSTFKQWNKGVRLAQGKYVWIAESDDYADERLLERLIPLLDSDARVVFAHCRSWRIEGDDRVSGFAHSYTHSFDPHRWEADLAADGREECQTYFAFGNTVQNASAVIFRKAAYESVGGADESLRLCGDWKLWAAIALTGRIAYLAEPLNYFRFHESSVRRITAQDGADAIEILQTVRWILNQATPTESNLEKMRETHASIWVPAVMSLHVPLETKRAIWSGVRSIDPHPFRRILRPALRTIQLKVARHSRSLRPTSSSTVQ